MKLYFSSLLSTVNIQTCVNTNPLKTSVCLYVVRCNVCVQYRRCSESFTLKLSFCTRLLFYCWHIGIPGLNPGGDEIFRPSRPVLGPTQPPV